MLIVSQDQLLQYLGVAIFIRKPTTDIHPSEVWPLMVQTHTLSFLLEVVLLRQQIARSHGGLPLQPGIDNAILDIWFRFLTSLKTAIVSFNNRLKHFEGEHSVKVST